MHSLSHEYHCIRISEQISKIFFSNINTLFHFPKSTKWGGIFAIENIDI